MTSQRWEPDGQLVASVLSTPKAARKMADLPDPDRAWLVAGLTLAGLTAKDIAAREGCSLRLVRSIRAWEMTQVCIWAQTQARIADAELRAERCEKQVTQQKLMITQVESARLRMQLTQLLDRLAVSGRIDTFSCGHPMIEYNVYKHDSKRYCKECRRVRQAARRKLELAV